MDKNIVNVIANLEKMRHMSPASKIDVLNAEFDLGLNFSQEFKDYVHAYGVITARHIEITGICESKNLNVVSVTLREREFNPLIPADMYVIESTGIEGMVILQNKEGYIYSIIPEKNPEKIFDCLADYLLSLQNQ